MVSVSCRVSGVIHCDYLLFFSGSVVSNSLRPQGLQHTRLLRPSPTFRIYSNSCPLSWWCHLTISSSVFPLPFSLQSFPAPGSFPMSLLFTSGSRSTECQLQHQSIQRIFNEISFRIDWFDLLAVQGTLKSFLQHHNLKASTLLCSVYFMVQLSYLYMTTGKTIALTRWTFVRN